MKRELPRTPDGRYFVHKGRLWRCTNPDLPEGERRELVERLMQARRAVGKAMRDADEVAERAARNDVNETKIALGERGPVWWTDGSPDYNRRMAHKTPYADWYAGLGLEGD